MARRPTGDRLVPLLEPKHIGQPPLGRLPSRPTEFPSSNPFLDSATPLSQWKVSTHVCTAAFPRTKIGCAVYPGSSDSILYNEPPARNMETHQVQAFIDNIVSRSDKPTADVNNPDHLDQPPLWVAANRYVPPKPDRNGYTLIFTHANGFSKELWEPTIKDILESPDCPPIADIWALDDVFNGDSALLNQDIIGPAYSWMDSGRDILNFILRYLPSIDEMEPPVFLKRQEIEDPELETLNESEKLWNRFTNESRTWRGRKIVCVGHSLGGGGGLLAASSLPAVFNNLIVIDPVVIPLENPTNIGPESFLGSAIKRRDEWPDLKTAKESMIKNKGFFGRWRSDVFERFIQFGLVQGKYFENRKKDLIVLRSAKAFEQAAYSDRKGPHRIGLRLPLIPIDLPVSWVIPKNGTLLVSWYEARMKDYLPQVEFTKVDRGGHLLPLDNPGACALAIIKALPNVSKTTTFRAKY